MGLARWLGHADQINGVGDGFDFVVFGWNDRTIYAPGFSEARFKRVAVGMTVRELTELMGEPVKKWEVADHEVWCYAWGAPDDDYWHRSAVISAGRVTGVHRFYFLD